MDYTLVTGACGGLGGAFVKLLAQRGEPLLLTGRSEKRLAELVGSLRAQYPDLAVEACPCDLADSASRQALFAYADERGIAFRRLVYVHRQRIFFRKRIEKIRRRIAHESRHPQTLFVNGRWPKKRHPVRPSLWDILMGTALFYSILVESMLCCWERSVIPWNLCIWFTTCPAAI